MSILLNDTFNGLELGLQRRINYEFNVATSTPVVLRFTSGCCYRILAREFIALEGWAKYRVIVNPATENLTNATPLPIYRTNTRITTPIGTEVLQGVVITGGTVVDQTESNSDKGRSPPPADLQAGGRIFKEGDVFYLEISRVENQPTRGYLNIVWQERELS